MNESRAAAEVFQAMSCNARRNDLEHEISRLTGEPIREIRRLGFQLHDFVIVMNCKTYSQWVFDNAEVTNLSILADYFFLASAAERRREFPIAMQYFAAARDFAQNCMEATSDWEHKESLGEIELEAVAALLEISDAEAHPEKDGRIQDGPLAEAHQTEQEKSPMADEQDQGSPIPASASVADWYVIHSGMELGPFSLGELVENAVAGKIDADDLVKQTAGLWKKARDVPYLQGHFFMKETKDQIAHDRLDPVPSWQPHSITSLNVATPHPAHELGKNVRAFFESNRNWLTPVAVVVGGGLVVWIVWFIVSRDLTGTTWQGSENLEGFGNLKFEFREKGIVVMTDEWHRAERVGPGQWTRDGSHVTMNFKDCQYNGTIDGSVIRGTAHFLATRRAWDFSVNRK